MLVTGGVTGVVPSPPLVFLSQEVIKREKAKLIINAFINLF
jgi:hypothetical protein